uniref:Putative ovule protein n=1 Tax=Solanum chacoense TaxID=4108 RepID=A0A0V0HG35_SOLCH
MTRKTIFLRIQATTHIAAFVNMLALVKEEILKGKTVTSLILTRLGENIESPKPERRKRRLLLPPSQFKCLPNLVCPSKSAFSIFSKFSNSNIYMESFETTRFKGTTHIFNLRSQDSKSPFIS